MRIFLLKVYHLEHPPWPSQPKACLGFVMIMMMTQDVWVRNCRATSWSPMQVTTQSGQSQLWWGWSQYIFYCEVSVCQWQKKFDWLFLVMLKEGCYESILVFLVEFSEVPLTLLPSIPHICHFFTEAKILDRKFYTEEQVNYGKRIPRQNSVNCDLLAQANYTNYTVYVKLHTECKS